MTRSQPEQDDGANVRPRLARVLPARIRERVFLPAYNDLLAERARSQTGRGGLFRLRILVMVLDSCRVGAFDAWLGLRLGFRRGFVVLLLVTVAIIGVTTLQMGDSDGDQTPYVPNSVQ